MQKNKILFVIHQLNYGGVQKALLSALNVINYSENEVTLYVRKSRVDLLDSVNTNVSRVIVNQDKTHYYRKPYAIYLTIAKGVSRFLRKEKWTKTLNKKLVNYLNTAKMQYEKEHYFDNGEEYDVAISYIQGYTAQFVSEYVRAKKKIMFYHGSTDETHELHEKIMSRFDKIVGVNEGVQNVLKKLYPKFADKMTYIENYVDAEAVRRKSREYRISNNNKEITLCTCGRLTPVKGFDLAIQVAKILKEKGIDFLWYFVGDGPERVKVEDRIELYGIKNHIVITGLQDNPYPYINACDIYVQPSYEEAHSLSIIEAQILKKPVVTTDTVGGRTLVKHNVNGMIADIDVDSLSNTVECLINDKKKREDFKNSLCQIDYSIKGKIYWTSWNDLLERNEVSYEV